MDDTVLLKILKSDLQMLTDANDDYLNHLINVAKEFIEREGIQLEDTTECSMIIVHYAAYLFRRRAGNDTIMPRYLRYELNNLLFAQKGKVE